MSDVTPAEEDLPLIISVDDHVMEPKDLWQQQLPPSKRDRGPRVVQEQVRLVFEGGHYGFVRDDQGVLEAVDPSQRSGFPELDVEALARREQVERRKLGEEAGGVPHARPPEPEPVSAGHGTGLFGVVGDFFKRLFGRAT